MAVGSLLTVVHQLAEVAVPVVIGVTIDRAIATGDGAAMARWTVVLAGLFAVLSFAGCVGLYVEERAVTGTTHRMRLAVARRVLDPGGGVEDALPGQVVSLSTVETARIGEGVGAVILGVGALAGTIAATVLLLTTSLSLGLVVVLGLPALLLTVQVLSRPLTARAEAQQEAVGSAAGVAADLFSGLRVLKGLGAEAPAADRYRRASGDALGAALDANRVRAAYLGVTLTAAGGFLALVTWIGGRQALDGTISIGQLVAALGVTQFLVGPLTRLTYLVGVTARARASASRIGAALTVPPAVRGGNRRLPARLPPASASGGTRARDEAAPATPPVHGQDVRRGHMPASGGTLAAPSPVPGRGDAGRAADAGRTTDPHQLPARPGVGLRHGLRFEALGHGPVQDVDLEISAGQLLGIVATEPADAAALVSCLDCTTEPDEGRVTVDGVPLGDLDLDEARRVVVVAHHDARLFEGTLGENLAAAAPPGTDADLMPVLVAADADEVVDTVPGGLDASVTEGGRSLSGGQRQRVALARALAADPPVLVLHEPTTAVDAATEHRIAAGIRSWRAGHRTTLLVTTSPTLLAATDRVVLVEGGRIVTDGTHADLAATDPRYRMVVLS